MDGKFLRFIDRIFGVLLYIIFSIMYKKHESRITGKNVLAIKLWALGESVLILPALNILRKCGYKISVIATKQNKTIFEGLNFIDEIIILNLNPFEFFKTIKKIRGKRFDICIDFEPYTKFSSVLSLLSNAKMRIGFSNRSKLYTNIVEPNEDIHAVKNFINLISVLHRASYPKKLVELKFTKQDKNRIKSIMKEYMIKKSNILIGVHAGSASSSISRRWSEYKFAELCDKLIENYNANIILIGGKNEKKINDKIISITKNKDKIIDFSGKLKLKELFALMKYFDLFIANDSGPMHISAAMGVKTIGLFGPNLPERYGPYGNKNIGLYKGNGIPAIRPFKGIFSENNEINKIEVEDVIRAVNILLKK
ncbi:MAG: glycosyltransferase family 9 protein [Candidatus Aenigmatarchaeota archaeon]